MMMNVEAALTGDDRSVAALVRDARAGGQQAWDALVERYAPLVWSICQRNRMSRADAEDISQNVWLKLVQQLGKLRDPAALPGWLATTTQRECCQFVRAAHRERARVLLLDAESVSDQSGMVEQELLAAEFRAALREAFRLLPPGCQQLLALLIQEPPVPYATISAQLGIPVGSIGPSRSRCLDRLRRHPAVAAWISSEARGEVSTRRAAPPIKDHQQSRLLPLPV
jgi:RNA polymerase sigma factor (sigma-70 family)